MNSDYETGLEARIERELRDLPELEAPAGLSARVMAAIEARTPVRWYRRPWPQWHLGWQAVSLALLLAFFAGLCGAGWKVMQLESVASVLHDAGHWLSGLAVLWRSLNVVAELLTNAVKQVHSGILIGCMAAVALGYAIFVALAACYVRIGLAQQINYEQNRK